MSVGTAGITGIEKDIPVCMYRKMRELRRFEEKVRDVFGRNLIPGTLHLYVSEKAAATGVCSDPQVEDYVASTHKGCGRCVAKGANLNKMVAGILGKKTGYCRGRGGSMYVADVSVRKTYR